MLAVRNLEEEGRYIFFATRNGQLKKPSSASSSTSAPTASTPSTSKKEDELVAATITNGNQIVFIATHEGAAVRLTKIDVRPMGRPPTA